MITDSEIDLRDGGLLACSSGDCGVALPIAVTPTTADPIATVAPMSNCEMLRGMTASTPVNCMMGRVAAARSLPL